VPVTISAGVVERRPGETLDSMLKFADEALYAGDKQHEGILKGLITEGSLLIEAKYRTPVMAANLLHLLVEQFNFSLALQPFLVAQVCRNPLDHRHQFFNAVLQSVAAGHLLPVNHLIQRTGSLQQTIQVLKTCSRFGQQRL
jgi:hypothetical protein